MLQALLVDVQLTDTDPNANISCSNQLIKNMLGCSNFSPMVDARWRGWSLDAFFRASHVAFRPETLNPFPTPLCLGAPLLL